MRILIIRFSSIGDIVQCTSVIESIRRYIPGSTIDFLTLTDYESILKNHEMIDSIITLNRTASYTDLIQLAFDLNKNAYSWVVDLHGSLRSILIRLFMKQTRSITINKPRWKRLLLKQFHYNRFSSDFSYKSMLHGPLKKLGIKETEYPATSLCLTKHEIESHDAFLAGFRIQKPYRVIIPGAAWENKQWAESKYSEFFQESDEMLQTVIIGSNMDTICDSIAQKNENLLNLKGRTSLRESLRIISEARLCIGSDTGLVHAAEAFGIPVISITGPTSKEMGAGSQLKDSITYQDESIWCRPCSQNGSLSCYREKRFCMENLSVTGLLEAESKLLQS